MEETPCRDAQGGGVQQLPVAGEDNKEDIINDDKEDIINDDKEDIINDDKEDIIEVL